MVPLFPDPYQHSPLSAAQRAINACEVIASFNTTGGGFARADAFIKLRSDWRAAMRSAKQQKDDHFTGSLDAPDYLPSGSVIADARGNPLPRTHQRE